MLMDEKTQIQSYDPVANCDQSLTLVEGGITNLDTSDILLIEQRIYTVRGIQVMLDRDLAELYGIENRALKQAVRRNIDSFPDDFMFVLSSKETNKLIYNGVSQFVIPSGYNTGGSNMFAFTEQGVAMLASILKSPRARAASIMIMRAFVAMRRFLVTNAQIFQRLDRLDRKQLENEQKFEKVFAKFEENEPVRQGIFFDGQTYDAYTFVADRIRKAKSRIVLIDNYVDDTFLTILDKRASGVAATIYTMQISKAFKLDIDKHNAQYPAIDVKVFKNSHDRFMIIDDCIYHFGASIKDLGKKWFAVTLMTEYTADELLHRL